MPIVDAAMFQRDFARYQGEADREPVKVISHGKLVGAFLSPHDLAEYERLKGLEQSGQARTRRSAGSTETAEVSSDLASPEEAEAYDRWFRTKVETALGSTEPRIPHDEAMARIDALIQSKKRAAPRLDE